MLRIEIENQTETEAVIRITTRTANTARFLALLVLVLLPLGAACNSNTAIARTGGSGAAGDVNRQLAQRYFIDMWNRLDHATADQIVARDVVGHVNSFTLKGVDKLHARIDAIRKMYETMRFTIEELVVANDRVAVRWTQIGRHSGAVLGPTTAGKEFRVTGMSMFRMAAGRIAEIWVNSDDLGELAQIGAVKVPPGW